MVALELEQYLQDRASLIASEKSLRRDCNHILNATPHEIAADKYIREIRKHEALSVWAEDSVQHQDVPGFRNVFPGMSFLTAREVITRTKLFKIISKMPKGALLHCHLDATVNASKLLVIALAHPAMHVSVPTPLTPENLLAVLPSFHALPPSQFNSSTTLTESTPGEWVQMSVARDRFDPALGGAAGFDRWVLGTLMINPTEAYDTHNTVEKIWIKFGSTFIVAAGLLNYEPIWREYIREFLRSSIEDGISYVEARVMFYDEFMVGTNGVKDVPHSQWVRIFGEVIEEVKQEMKDLEREVVFFGAKIIYTTRRDVDCECLEWYLEDCIALKREFPHIIAGFDLVGDENTLHPLIYYLKPLLQFKERQKALGLDIPFIFHAGETLGDGNSVDDNLYDAILLGTKRIGHGFSLPKHPKLVNLCREKEITVEICPISNEILRLTSSMPAHPLPILMNNGVPVALCSDDPSVFGNMGLSFDFFQVLVASEVTGLITLGELARQSIDASTLTPTEKQAALQMWEKRWSAFVMDLAKEVA